MQNIPFNPQKTLNTAMQFMQGGQFNDALLLFKQLEDYGLNDPRLFRAMGSAYEHLRVSESALSYFKKSLALQPKQGDLQTSCGKLLSAEGRHSIARDFFQGAIELAPDNVSYQLNLVMCLLATKDYQKALAGFQEIIQREPHNIAAFIGVSRVHLAMGELPLALSMLQDKAIEHPTKIELVHELGWQCKDSGKTDDAIRWFEKCLALAPQNPNAFEDLALAWLDKGDFEKAIQIVSNGIKVNPLDQKLNKLLATVKFEIGHENHIDHYQVFAKQSLPEGLFYDYVQNLIKVNSISQAQNELDNVKVELKNSSAARSLQLSIWKKQKNFDAIIKTLHPKSNKGTTLDKHQIELLSAAYLAVGEGSNAIALIKPQIERYPDDQYYWALYTTALRQIGSGLYDKYCDYDQFVFQQPLQLDSAHSSIESFNQQLKSMLESLHTAKRNPLDQSLVGGTQTVGMLLNRQDQIIQDFKQALRRTFELAFAHIKYDPNHPVGRMANRGSQFSSSWSVKLNSQGFHVSHVHPKGWYSSAYYVDLPSEIGTTSKQGWLHMGKPGIFLQQPMAAERWIKPEIGQLVLFPSYFWHGTEPFESVHPRLSVGFDILPS